MGDYEAAVGAVLTACLLLAGCNAMPREQQTGPQSYETYVLAVLSNAPGQEELEAVQARINAILEERLGIHIQLLTFPFTSYDQKMREVLAGSDQVDVMLCMGSYVENCLRGNLLPLNELLAQYGQGVAGAVEEDAIQGCAVNSVVYGIPNIRDYAITTDTYYLNAAVLERNGFSADEIRTPEDLEYVFSVIHENEPDIVILSTYLQSLASNRRYLNPQTPLVSVLEEETDRYVNYFATEEYRSLLLQIRDWYQKGYVGLYSEAGQILAKPGEVLAMARCGKPGAEQEVSQMFGQPYQEVSFGGDIILQDTYTAITYTITKNTISPEQSIAMLMSMTAMSAQAFYDVPVSHPNAEAVNRLAKEGAISGVGGNLFAPDEEVNRGMAVTVLGRLAVAAETESDRFSDVEPNSWYSGYVGWAVDNGIVTGGTDGLFHPYDTVTGEQLNLMISRYAALVGKTMSLPAGSSAPVTRGELAQRLAQLLEEPKMGNIGVVQTESGLVSGIQGDLYEDITLFKGVPFAAPPVGDLRWHEPVDAEPWDGVRVCDTEGDAPLMPDYVNMLFSDPSTPWIEFYPEGAPRMSEDCLYLNIATPAQSADEKLPVVIWFHGGGFQNGYYSEPEFDPEVLASKGCVVVSVGMRLPHMERVLMVYPLARYSATISVYRLLMSAYFISKSFLLS